MLPSPAAKAVEMQPRSIAAARITEMIAAELFLTDISFLPFKIKMRPPQITEGARHGEAAPRRSCTVTPSDCPKVLTIILRRKAGIPTVTAMAVATDFHRDFLFDPRRVLSSTRDRPFYDILFQSARFSCNYILSLRTFRVNKTYKKSASAKANAPKIANPYCRQTN